MTVHHRKECTDRSTGRVIRVGDVEPMPDDVDMNVARNIIRARDIRKTGDERRARVREAARRKKEN